eukprot:m.91525 g.91525  ORF g.91525 m.91525 type:complete len:459 (+) comp8873_c7_seq2:227-1603(+)
MKLLLQGVRGSVLANAQFGRSLTVNTYSRLAAIVAGKEENITPFNTTSFVEIFPRSTEDVAAIITECNNDPDSPTVVPIGSGCRFLHGDFIGKNSVLINMSRMTSIVPGPFPHVRVEAGVPIHQFKYNNPWFPVEFHSNSDVTIGGVIATDPPSSFQVGYGPLRRYVLNVRAVLPTGKILETAGEKRNSVKSSAGLNMTDLLVGSKGDLGIITEVNLRCIPIGPSTYIHREVYSAASFEEIIQLSQNMILCGMRIARMAAIDGNLAAMSNDLSSSSSSKLLVEFHGSKPMIANQKDLLDEILEEQYSRLFSKTWHVDDFVEDTVDDSVGDTVDCTTMCEFSENSVRRTFISALGSSDAHICVMDISVPLSQLQNMYDAIQTHQTFKDFASTRKAGVVGFLGSGHLRILLAGSGGYNRFLEQMRSVAVSLNGCVLRQDHAPKPKSTIEEKIMSVFQEEL